MDKREQARKEWRNFGFSLTVIALIFASILLLKQRPAGFYSAGAAILLLILALWQPAALRPLFAVVSWTSTRLGRIMTPVILTLLYYLAVTPVGLLARLTGKRFLDLSFTRQEASYWRDPETAGQAGGDDAAMQNQF